MTLSFLRFRVCATFSVLSNDTVYVLPTNKWTLYFKTVVADQMTLPSMNNSTQISKIDQIDAIWSEAKSNKENPVYQGTLKDLKLFSEEDILALFNQLPEEEGGAIVYPDVVIEQDSSIKSQVTAKGEHYFTIGLPLVETNGLAFKFTFGESVVVVSNDIDLYKLHKSNPIAIGEVMQFNYEGADTFKKLDAKGTILVANNSKESPYKGTLSKSCNEIFVSVMEAKTVAQFERKVALLETADEMGVSVRQVRQVLSANLATDISALMKAKLGKK